MTLQVDCQNELPTWEDWEMFIASHLCFFTMFFMLFYHDYMLSFVASLCSTNLFPQFAPLNLIFCCFNSTLNTIYTSSVNLSYSFISSRISIPIYITFAIYQKVLFEFDIPAHLIMWNREMCGWHSTKKNLLPTIAMNKPFQLSFS